MDVPFPPSLAAPFAPFPELIPYYRRFRHLLPTLPESSVITVRDIDTSSPDRIPVVPVVPLTRDEFPRAPAVVSPILLMIHLLALLRDQELATGAPTADSHRTTDSLAAIASAYTVIRPSLRQTRYLSLTLPARRRAPVPGEAGTLGEDQFFTPLTRYGFTMKPVQGNDAARDRSLPRTLSLALMAEVAAAIDHFPLASAKTLTRNARLRRAVTSLRRHTDTLAPESPYLIVPHRDGSHASPRSRPSAVSYIVPADDISALAKSIAILSENLETRERNRAGEAAADQIISTHLTSLSRLVSAFRPASLPTVERALSDAEPPPPTTAPAPPPTTAPAPPPPTTPPPPPTDRIEADEPTLNVRDMDHALSVLSYLPDDARRHAAHRAVLVPHDPSKPTAFRPEVINRVLRTALAPLYPEARITRILSVIATALASGAPTVPILAASIDAAVTSTLALTYHLRDAADAHRRRASANGRRNPTMLPDPVDAAAERLEHARSVAKSLNLPPPPPQPAKIKHN